ncbi:Peptidase family M23 [Sphingobium sp. AP50]|uniref:M23 family metallopeptidase n=1 Tax=Sphingobium sp. AP50 TaxID=1884369 RepID=UPI0008BFAF8A|nr:M23 family metallopeptidase [Sphingobium sp. AP50]SEJ60447.1 Peptidase family M23 [Sphingobium sp. AP50]SEJ70415.1 Peptidase family M23 [Sphingobium sp. AP50]
MTARRRSALWGGGVTALLFCVAFAHYCVRIVPADEALPVPAPEMSRPVDQGLLLIPVEGVPASALTDTFSQARAGGARPHDAIDIMAARGRVVLAAADGRIEKLFWSEAGGRTLYERSADGRLIYYYAHLDGYAPGLREGQGVRRGQRIATVGSTGNADPAAPHLHFAVNVMQPGESWHGGRPVNPYPLLVRR